MGWPQWRADRAQVADVTVCRSPTDLGSRCPFNNRHNGARAELGDQSPDRFRKKKRKKKGRKRPFYFSFQVGPIANIALFSTSRQTCKIPKPQSSWPKGLFRRNHTPSHQLSHRNNSLFRKWRTLNRRGGSCTNLKNLRQDWNQKIVSLQLQKRSDNESVVKQSNETVHTPNGNGTGIPRRTKGIAVLYLLRNGIVSVGNPYAVSRLSINGSVWWLKSYIYDSCLH